MKRALLVLVALVLVARGVTALELARFAEIELVGPLANVVLEARGGGRTHIEGALGAGETRLVAVPLSVPDRSTAAPTIKFDEDPDPSRPRGSARFVGWRKDPAPLEGLSPGLKARARPALLETPLGVSRAAPFVLLLSVIVVLFLRRRPFVALAAALLAAAALASLVTSPVREAGAAVTLVDGHVDETNWRQIDAALDRIVVAPEAGAFELATDPAQSMVTWEAPLDPTRPLSARAPRARLFATRVVEVSSGSLSRAANRLAAFDEAWLREDGAWKHFGAWDFGAPLPAPLDTALPPGWLASALPQGISILLARERPSAARSSTWIRVAGL